MKRFGPAPQFIDVEERVPVPVGEACGSCGEPIAEGDSGMIMPCLAYAAGGPVAGELVQHIECAARQALGSVGHQLQRCHCYGGTEDDPPGLSRRAAARAAWDLAEVLRQLRKVYPIELCLAWLEAAHGELEWRKPIDMIRAGQGEIVADMFYRARRIP